MKKWSKTIAIILFVVFWLELLLQFNYMIMKDYPLVISDKWAQIMEMVKTSICIFFFYGVWKGYI